jgi:hypothetical protein
VKEISGTPSLRHRHAPNGVQRTGNAENPPFHLRDGTVRGAQARLQEGGEASVPVDHRQPGGDAEGVVLVARAAVPCEAAAPEGGIDFRDRGTAEQWIKEGKNAVTWTRLSCESLKANAVRLQLHALAYNLANFLRTLALPAEVAQWSLSTLRDRLVKTGAKVVRHGRSITFQMAEVMVPRALFQKILAAIAALRPLPPARC